MDNSHSSNEPYQLTLILKMMKLEVTLNAFQYKTV